MNKEEAYKLTIIIPSLNPDEKLTNTIKSVLEQGFTDIILVNDGSDAAHMGPFEEAVKHPEITLLTHEVNKGKGRALKTAFEYYMANRQGAGVITMDGDGQHHPEDVFNCGLAMLERNEVILGVRDFSQDDVPWKSRFGNNLTRFIFNAFCGIKITDTQTGLRAFPTYTLPHMLSYAGERFEYETNMLLQMKKEKLTFSEVVIRTIYLDDNASTHFHPLKDGWKIYKIIIKYSAGTFIKFLISSGLSCLIDLGLFALLSFLLPKTGLGLTQARLIMVATIGARIVSSLCNYFMNRKVVFASDSKASIVRYYILAACQMLISGACVAGIVALIELASKAALASTAIKTVIKGIVDFILFFISYKIQKKWVFKTNGKEI